MALAPEDPKFIQHIKIVEDYSKYQVQKSMEHFAKQHASSPPRKEKKKKTIKKRKRYATLVAGNDQNLNPTVKEREALPEPVPEAEPEPPQKKRRTGDIELSKRTLLSGMKTGIL